MRGGTGGLKGAMKNTGVIRKIDDLGRVVIPKELRRTLDISDDDPMEIFFDDETAAIFIQKFNMKRCVFCDSHVDVSEFMNKHICESCISQLFETED
jgi:transcriptional pleiotropic regulator of transition state genes